eukprot:TRINITY_DN2221_c0_g1_i1.p1 TRINITY_DN2221_c0_g1~~TRINITY_DN2221_c0_g1_i1.p1  ORF type:complete len:775 (+),score=243.28 TRINITY_DN2221_c0_g1_i1:98-2422(+)
MALKSSKPKDLKISTWVWVMIIVLGGLGLGIIILAAMAGGRPKIRDSFKGDRGEKLTECLCYDTTVGGPCEGANDMCIEYVTDVAKELWPSIFLWLMFWCVCCWRCARCCCSCCGSNVPSKGFCGGKRSEGFRGYTYAEHRFYRFIVASVILFALALIPAGLTKNQQVTDGFIDIGGILDRWTGGINNTVNILVYEFGRLPEKIAPVSVQLEIKNAQGQVGSSLQSVTDAKEDFLDYDHRESYSRKRITFLFGGLMFFGALVVGLVGFFGCHQLIIPGATIAFLFLLATLCFLVAIIAHIIAIFTDDICANYGPLTNDLLGRVSKELGCLETSTTNMAQIMSQTEAVKNNMAGEICLYTSYICRFFTCSAGSTLESCLASPRQFLEVMDEFLHLEITGVVLLVPPFNTCTSVPCTLRACEKECAAGSTDDPIKNLLTYLLSSANVVSIIEMEVYPVANCLSMYTLRDELGEPLCNKVSAGLVTIFFLLLCILILYVSSSIFLTLAQKRYAWKYVELTHVEAFSPAVEEGYRPWLYAEVPSAPPAPADADPGKTPPALPSDSAEAGENEACEAAPLPPLPDGSPPPPQAGSSDDAEPAGESEPTGEGEAAVANIEGEGAEAEAAPPGGVAADSTGDPTSPPPESDMTPVSVEPDSPQGVDPQDEPQTPDRAEVTDAQVDTSADNGDAPVDPPEPGANDTPSDEKEEGAADGEKETTTVEEPTVEEPKVEEPKVDEPKVDEPKVEGAGDNVSGAQDFDDEEKPESVDFDDDKEGEA